MCHEWNVHHFARSRNFALLVGIFYTGGTIGPIISGFLSEQTGNVITVLYATTILHVIYASIAWFALPESVSEASMIHARNHYANELASAADANAGPFRRRLMVFTKAFWHSFPLHVLTPKRLPNSRWKRDYNLALLALSAGLINVIMARLAHSVMRAWLTQTPRRLRERCINMVCILLSGHHCRYGVLGRFPGMVNFLNSLATSLVHPGFQPLFSSWQFSLVRQLEWTTC